MGGEDGLEDSQMLEMKRKIKQLIKQQNFLVKNSDTHEETCILKKSENGSFYYMGGNQNESLKEVGEKSCIVGINATRKKIWDIFIIVLAIYNCFQIPIEIAFEPPTLEKPGF